jgi:hypothetical protein
LFYGIEDGRARIGLHVREFGDAEVAAGVLAHEVAHAFHEHHALVVHDREKEEFLTDLTTIALGFGILTTNNTDRYRSTGNYSQTTWSTSSVGYLPPHAMAYARALWLRARGDDEEVRSATKHLEPNQLACFNAALEDLDSEEKPAQDRLGGRDRTPTSIDWKAFVPRTPSPDEIYERDSDEDHHPQSNAGETGYATPNDSSFAVGIWAAIAGFTIGWMAGIVTFDGMASLRPVWLGLSPRDHLRLSRPPHGAPPGLQRVPRTPAINRDDLHGLRRNECRLQERQRATDPPRRGVRSSSARRDPVRRM